MPRSILLSAAVILVLSACRDDRIPTAPETAAPAVAPVLTESVVAASGVSSICLVNRRALADLDGQLQDNPDNASLQAAHAVQSAITADVCD